MSLLIMLSALDEQEAREVLTCAHEQAYEKQALSFALSLPQEISPEGRAFLSSLGPLTAIVSDADPFESLYALYHGEERVLMASEGMVFKRFWDLRLKTSFASLKKQKAALTGFLPDVEDLHGSVCPVAVDKVENGFLHFHKGAPLYRAQRPQRCAFVNPWFCYGTPGFFACMAVPSETPAFLRPFENGYTLYTLSDPCIETVFEQRIDPMPLSLITPDGKTGSVVNRFVETFALPDSPYAILGLYTPDLQYDMDVPLLYKAKEALRQFRQRKVPVSPLFVTAYKDMTCPVKHEAAIYESRFHNLARLKNLPLALFIRGGVATAVKRYFHNVYDYQRAYSLPPDIVMETELERFKASRFALLHHAMMLFPHHTHYAWIDFGFQRFPVYGGVALDFRPITGTTIHLARVNGVLDPSCFTVPAALVPQMHHAMEQLVRERLDEGLAVNDVALFEALLSRETDLFTIHDLPEKRSLFLTAMQLKKGCGHDR